MQRAESRDNNEMNGRVAIRTKNSPLRYTVWLKSCTLVTAKGGINRRSKRCMSTREGNTRSKHFADEGVSQPKSVVLKHVGTVVATSGLRCILSVRHPQDSTD